MLFSAKFAPKGSTKSILICLSMLLGLLISGSVLAQDCGTVLVPAQVTLEQEAATQIDDFTRLRMPAIAYEVPLAIHIVRRSNGTGGFTPAELDVAITDLNAQNLQVGWTFYVAGEIDYIDDDFYFENTNTFSMFDQLKQVNPVSWAVNIYFAPSTGYCGVSSFTTSSVQGILMDNACAGSSFNNSTFAHEVGHYFDLYHTHETAFATECPDGSNCDIAGDLLCDTPADPKLSGHINSSTCTYDNAVSPPAECDATPYAPQPDNLMSYSTKLCRDLFTPDQVSKMIYTIENRRPELSKSWGGLSVVPASVAPFNLQIGTSNSTTVTIHQTENNENQISGVTNTLSELSVSGPFPAGLTDLDSAVYNVTFDATLLTSDCEIRTLYDTLRFTTTSTERPVIEVPVEITISYVVTNAYNFQMGHPLLQFTAPNSAGFGNQTGTAFSLFGQNALYDGTLMLGLIDGLDTVVYQDAFGAKDYGFVDTFLTETDGDGRVSHSLRFATNDGRLYGKVVYTYHSTGGDGEQWVIAHYELYNHCDTGLEVYAALFSDFDVVNSGANMSGFDVAANTVWVGESYSSQSELETSINVVGMTLLSDVAHNMRSLSNPVFVYPNSALVESEMYTEMVAPGNQDGTSSTDWSAIVTIGAITIGTGETARWTAALLYSMNGTDELMAQRSSALSYYNGLTSCCAGSVGNVNDDPGDIVDIGDLTRLIDYLFISFDPVVCTEESNVNVSPDGVVDIGDLTKLIDFLFISFIPLPNCP